MKKAFFIPFIVLASFAVSPIYAAPASVGQIVAELRADMMNSSATERGKTKVNSVLDQCASQRTTAALCGCLNQNLPSKAQRVVNKCYSLSSR